MLILIAPLDSRQTQVGFNQVSVPDFGWLLLDLDVRVDALEGPEAGLAVVDAQGLPVQHVRQSLSPVAHDDPLAPVHLGELVQLLGQLVDGVVQPLREYTTHH